MKPQSKQTPRNILSSVDEYEFRHLNSIQRKQIEQNQDDEIFFSQKSNDQNQIQRYDMKINNKNRSTRKKSQRYINGKKQKNPQLFFSKTYGQNFFSCSKKVTQRQEVRQTHKTISTYEMLAENQRDPRVIQLALRYGILNKKSKNSFNEILKKRSKKTNNLKINQFFEYKNPKLSIDSNVNQKFQNALIKNKKTLEAVIQDPNKYDQNFSLMLDRKKVLQSGKQYEKDQIYGNFSMNGPKKQFPNNIKISQKKNVHKIQVFINEKIERDTNHLKNKIHKKQMAKTCFNQFPNQKDLLKSNFIDKPLQKQSKILNNNWSNKIYFPQNQRPIKQASFTAVKNTTERIEHKDKIEQKKQLLKGRKSDIDCNRKQSKVEIIPNSIIFKKKQSSDSKKIGIGKIVKNTSKQISFNEKDSNVVKKFQKSQNPINLFENIESKHFLQRKIFSKDRRPSTQGSPSRQSRKQNYAAKNQLFTFIFDSKDHPYIAEYLVVNNWVPFGTNKLNSDCTLKWVNNPINSQIMKLKDGQFYNHFHKSFQLTSKSFLSLNLRANQYFLKIDSFFPETYDVGNQMERNQFIKKFKYNVMMSLLENLVFYCFEKGKISRLMKRGMQIEDSSGNVNLQSEKIFQNQSFNVIEFQNYRNRDQKFQINIFLTILAIKYFRKERTKHFIDFKEKKTHFLRFKKDQFDSNFQTLEFYSKQQNVSQSYDSKGLYSYHFATPSDLLLEILFKEYSFFHKLNNWKNSLQSERKNCENIWIVKPSSNARGNGIYLQANLGSILKSAKDIQSRIVQKYLQKPLLFKKTLYPHLNDHKFDIRQWVLLKSLDPLEIYMFSHFYIRLASEKYELYPIDNNKVHLTNFSANKQFFDNQQDSIVNSDEFIKFLRQEFKINWQDELKPKVKEIIIKSIQSCQQKLEIPQNGTCFELLGYDIFIDEQFHPWLIEVNMSPACEQRTPWLADYLKNMNEELLEIVLPQTHISKKPSEIRQQRWQKIHFQEYHFNPKDCNSKLEIVSTNLQMKNKLSKQNQAIKSRKSIQGPGSPHKSRPSNPLKKTIPKQSTSKVKKNVDQEKQTLNDQTNRIKTISQIELDPLNQSIQSDDLIENQQANDKEILKFQLMEQIEQISQEMNDSFEKNISEKQELFQEFQEQAIQNDYF